MRRLGLVCLSAAAGLAALSSARADTAKFDFDNGSPPLTIGESTPFDQAAGGVDAHFSSPSDPSAFSVQSDQSTQFHLSWFSGQYLYPDSIYGLHLRIAFKQWQKKISLTFATVDYDREIPSDIELDAYANTTDHFVGSARTHGEYVGDTFPEGTLTFDGGGKEFNLVEIYIPRQDYQACCLLVDDVVVTPVPTGACCFADGSCQTLTGSDCTGAGGTYQGDATKCTPNPCPQPPTGACCYADGSCLVLTATDCAAGGGTYQGDGAACDPNPCPPPDPCVGVTRGDSNGDGSVDFNDIDCFVAALIEESQWLACGTVLTSAQFACANDINQDGSIDFNDIDGFVVCLDNGGCR